MHISRVAAVVAAVTLFATTACGGEDPEPESSASTEPRGATSPTPTEPTTEPSKVPTSESPPMESMSQGEIEQVLTTAWLTKAGAAKRGMAQGTEPSVGLHHNTESACVSDGANTSDNLRLARAQNWWESDGPADDWYWTSHEVVHYEPGGVQKYVQGLTSMPELCTTVDHGNGDTSEYSTSSGPDGLVAEATVIARVSVLGGTEFTGYTTVVSAGDFAGMTYVEARSQQKANELTVDMTNRLAKKIKKIQEDLAPST